MKHDLLLEWASERGCGSWDQLRRAHDWLFSGRDRPRFMTPGFTVGILSTLGHIEMDWQAGRWAVTPPILTLLPDAGAHALLTGGRTRALMSRLKHELATDESFYPLPPRHQELAPSAVMIPCQDAAHVESLAERLAISFEYSVSERLAALLPELDAYLALARSAPPPRGYGFRRFDVRSLGWTDTDDDQDPGLYRYESHQGFVFQLLDGDGRSYRVDMPLGIYAAMSRWGENHLRYFRHSVNGEFTVPIAAPLPALHARIAALCSGLAPRRQGRVLVYANVPARIADRIAQALDQTLQVFDGV